MRETHHTATTTKEGIMSNGTITNVTRDHAIMDDYHFDLLTVEMDDGEIVIDTGKDFDAGNLNVGDRVAVSVVKFHGRKTVNIDSVD